MIVPLLTFPTLLEASALKFGQSMPRVKSKRRGGLTQSKRVLPLASLTLTHVENLDRQIPGCPQAGLAAWEHLRKRCDSPRYALL